MLHRRSPFRSARSRRPGLFASTHVAGRSSSGRGRISGTSTPHVRASGDAVRSASSVNDASARWVAASGRGGAATRHNSVTIDNSRGAPSATAVSSINPRIGWNSPDSSVAASRRKRCLATNGPYATSHETAIVRTRTLAGASRADSSSSRSMSGVSAAGAACSRTPIRAHREMRDGCERLIMHHPEDSAARPADRRTHADPDPPPPVDRCAARRSSTPHPLLSSLEGPQGRADVWANSSPWTQSGRSARYGRRRAHQTSRRARTAPTIQAAGTKPTSKQRDSASWVEGPSSWQRPPRRTQPGAMSPHHPARERRSLR